MKSLIHDITCSDIKFIELKLKRINLTKERLIKTKPSVLNLKKYKEWEIEYNKNIKEEQNTLKELNEAYIELEKYL